MAVSGSFRQVSSELAQQSLVSLFLAVSSSILKGGCYVAVATLWVVVSPCPSGDDDCVHACLRLHGAIPLRWLRGLLREYAKD